MAGTPLTAPRADDVFYCPTCGQKHRGDLSTIKLGGALRAKCAGCGIALTVSWSDEHAVVRPRDAVPSKEGPVERDVPKNASPTAEIPVAATKRSPLVSARGKAAAPEGRAAPRTKRERERAKEKEDAPVRDLEPIEAEFGPGTKVDRYTVEEAIGQGGTGTVYRAFDPTTNRLVALKFLGANQSESMRQRFLREIEVQANLRHPNLMPVFDRGEHEGRPFFTMELLYKPFTLTQIVTMGRSGTLGKYATLKSFDDLENLIRDVYLPVCDGIHIANVENGVVHRDLKPDNILLDSRTLRPYVIDFGICHVLEKKARTGGVALEPTAEDAGIVGTPRFLAPEQARGTIHERTDVWGLGAILYYCLTGDAPIAASTPITRAELGRRIEALKVAEKAARADGDETRAELCSDKLSRLEDAGLRTLDDLYKDARDGNYVPLPSGVPAAAAAIVRKAMAPKTVERYVNARSLGSDVESWLDRGQTRAMAEQGSSAASVVQGVQRGLKASVLTAAIALAVGGGAYLLGRSSVSGKAGGPATESVRGVLGSLDGIERRIQAAKPRIARLTPADAALLYDVFADDIADERKAAEALPAGSERDSAVARAAFVTDRIAPARVKVEMPGGAAEMTLEDISRGTKRDLPGGESVLAPGEYRLTIGSGVRIPFVMPFLVREAGKVADREPPKVKIVLPIAASQVPDGLALVVPGLATVDHRGPPYWTAATVPATVVPFLIDKREVTNADWLLFLEALPDADRKARAPALDFAVDPEHPGHWMLAGDATRSKQLPVRGITPDAARAYCAWRSQRDGATVRLPTEAEWVIAAGGQLKYDLPGGAKGTLDEGDYAAPVNVMTVKDMSPYGVYGMLGNVREIVTSVNASEGATDQFLSKGAGAGDDPSEAAIRKIRPVGREVSDPRTGLRCVRLIK